MGDAMTVLQGWIVIGLLVFALLFLWDIGSRLRDIFRDTTQARDALLAIQDQGRKKRSEGHPASDHAKS